MVLGALTRGTNILVFCRLQLLRNVKASVVFIVFYITVGIICSSNARRSKLELIEILNHFQQGFYVSQFANNGDESVKFRKLEKLKYSRMNYSE